MLLSYFVGSLERESSIVIACSESNLSRAWVYLPGPLKDPQPPFSGLFGCSVLREMCSWYLVGGAIVCLSYSDRDFTFRRVPCLHSTNASVQGASWVCLVQSLELAKDDCKEDEVCSKAPTNPRLPSPCK